jgi:predicted aspartyl protease
MQAGFRRSPASLTGMIRRVGAAALLLLGLAACGGPPAGSVEACAFVRQASFAIHVEQNRALVDVQLDGKPATLMLDSGSNATLLTRAAEDRLKLPMEYSKVERIDGVGGSSFGHPVHADIFSVGELKLSDRTLPVGGFEIVGRGGITPDGFLGTDVIGGYDIDLDLPGQRVTLYRARDCPNGAPPWSFPSTRLAAPPTAPGLGYAFISAIVNGHPLLGFLDSGADVTTIDRTAALSIGISEGELDQDRAVAMSGAVPFRAASRVHRFASLRIGDDQYNGLRLVVTALPVNTASMLVGMDYLHTHRIWISLQSRVVYISHPTAPALAGRS